MFEWKETMVGQPGPIYDDAVKVLSRLWPTSLCRVLGVDVHRDVRPIQLSQNVPTFSGQVDALVALDDATLLHIESQTTGARDFALRMLEYWVRLRQVRDLRGYTIRQHVIVLKDGDIEGRLSAPGIDFRFDVHYLRDQPVSRFLRDATVAPFAVLARLREDRRPDVLRDALDLIGAVPDDRTRGMLGRAATDLARLRLDRATIEAIWKESTMPVPSFTQELIDEGLREGLERGRQQGIAEGRQEGRQEERCEMVRSLLRVRFGPDERLAAIASQLAQLDPSDIAERVESAGSLDDLL